MVRHRPIDVVSRASSRARRAPAARLAGALAIAAALSACGIKGPLTLPPRTDAAKPATAPPGPAIPAIPDATTLPPDSRGTAAP